MFASVIRALQDSATTRLSSGADRCPLRPLRQAAVAIGAHRHQIPSVHYNAWQQAGLRVGLMAAISTMAWAWPVLAEPATCGDLRLSEAQLTQVLDSTLGDLRPFVLNRAVQVDSRQPTCYLRMSLDIGIGGAKLCAATACSSADFSGSRLGIRGFTVLGCDQVFALTGAGRKVKTAWTDIADRLETHCGRSGFEISGLKPEGTPGSGSVLVSFNGPK